MTHTEKLVDNAITAVAAGYPSIASLILLEIEATYGEDAAWNCFWAMEDFRDDFNPPNKEVRAPVFDPEAQWDDELPF